MAVTSGATRTRPSSTKSEEAYWAIREAIVTGEIKEEAQLDDAELMLRFGVGRTPLREALKRLAMEEFVIWPAHRTPYVRTTSASDLSQLYEARHIFEVPAARFAAERASQSELRKLADACDGFDEAIDADAMYKAAEHDYDFHLGIAEASHNRFLVDAVSHLNRGSLRLWYLSYTEIGVDGINEGHRRALSAMRERDPDSAAVAARDHIRFSHQRQLELHGLNTIAEFDVFDPLAS